MTSVSVECDYFGSDRLNASPKYSVIIPFYGDTSFITTIFYLQQTFDSSFEIIVVCDDPRITEEIRAALIKRKRFYTLRTTLICPSSNLGYGPANNLAASLARGTILILMNSDVLVLDPIPLVQGCEFIVEEENKGRDAIVGYSLLFEDDTIQHLGIDFVRSDRMGGLYIARHPQKGTPFAWHKDSGMRRSVAVTGALLSISRGLYSRLSGFDAAFARGDFEDADLCLRARRLGAAVWVLVHPGLYHFERQTIRRLPPGEQWRMTIENCRRFNERWAEEIPAKVRVIRGAQAKGGGR